MSKTGHDEIVDQLDQFYAQGEFHPPRWPPHRLATRRTLTGRPPAKRQILRNQSAITGLFPANSAENSSASIKTSLWAASSIFALYLAYSKRVDNDQGKAHDLGQSVVKCMRGILFAWMRQSEKVESFKANQCPKHALHLKFDLHSGLANDFDYPHLQIDVVSLYLIFLANFIASGLDIIYCMDEVTFIQNLVYYVERAYRTPDFGNWEPTPTSSPARQRPSGPQPTGAHPSPNPPRAHSSHQSAVSSQQPLGYPAEAPDHHQHKSCVSCTNEGQSLEIHATSIGMAKSALEAINGCNLFGGKGANWSIIYSDIDAHSRNRSIFETLLPRESRSKNTDSYLLATISWPCFATNDPTLYSSTKSKILRKLKGKYGLKRFLRDPYGTALAPEGASEASGQLQHSNSLEAILQVQVLPSVTPMVRETSFGSTTSSSSLSLGEQPRTKQRKSSYYQRKNFFRAQGNELASGGAEPAAGSGSLQRTDSASRMSKRFEHIESEWPLFVCFLIIDGIFKQDPEQVYENEKLLYERLLRTDERFGDYLMPKYYYVPAELIKSEKCHPDTVERLPSAEGSSSRQLYLTGQAILLTTRLLLAGLLHPNELDPLRRHMPSHERPRRIGRYSSFQATASDLVVQTVLIAESIRLQAMMANYGIQTQTPLEVEPVQIWSSAQLVRVYEYLGVNEKLGLRGRPARPIGALGTSKLYRICGQTILCYPLIFEVSDFYLAQDMLLLIDDIQNELNFIGRYWRMSGRPTVCIIIREQHLKDVHFRDLLDLLVQFKNGQLKKSGLRIKTGRLQNLISSSCIEHLDFLHLLPHEHLPQFKSFRQLVESPKQSLLIRPAAGHSSPARAGQASGKGRRLMCSASSHNLQAIEEQSGPDNNSAEELAEGAHEQVAAHRAADEQLLFSMSDASMYRLSSLDLDQNYSTEPCHSIDYYECYKEAPTWPTLVELLRTCGELSGQSQLLAILWEREGAKYCVDELSVEDRLERVSQLACEARNWSVVRYCSAVLKRSVESISPWLTSILVKGKQISLGTGANEKIINNPLTPTEIHTLLYSTVNTKNPCDAVLQQEIALYIGRLISTRPDYFDGILTIRVANFMSAMRSYLNIKTNERKLKQEQMEREQQVDDEYPSARLDQTRKVQQPASCQLDHHQPHLLDLRIRPEPQPSTSSLSLEAQAGPSSSQNSYGQLSFKSPQQIKLEPQQTRGHKEGPRPSKRLAKNLVARPLESLSPSGVRKLLVKVLTDDESMPISDQRQITGELCRVPKDFYDKVWSLLSCTNIGIVIGGKTLRSLPILTNMTQDDLNFALKVEALLSSIDCPKLRQVNVELLMALHNILERNPEIRFESDALDLDKIIKLALEKFRADHGREEFGLREFYCNASHAVALYAVRTVFDCLLPAKYKERADFQMR